jgi:phage baseplate assembly protein W
MSEISLALPFSLDSSGNIRITSDQSTIWSNRVRSAVGTALGERVMRPTYGTEVPRLLFDTTTAMEEGISMEVGKVFSASLPLLTLNSVESVLNERDGTLTAEINYSLPNKQDATTVVGNITVSLTNPPYEELL